MTTPHLMDRIDAVVIGAGVVGLAVARALALQGREVVVLEKEKMIGTGISSRNSEVIHAGLYYPPGSHKALLCVAGREQLYDYCARRGVAHRRCGKLIVATEESQLPALAAIAAKSRANGVPIEELSEAQATRMEPALRCVAALHSPTTGIIDSHGLMAALRGELEQLGGVVALDTAVQTIRPAEGQLAVLSGSVSSEPTSLLAPVVINAAGLHAISLAKRCEGLDSRFIPRAYFGKGSYFSLAGRAPFSRLIYPVPPANSLGTHLTLDLGGQARFGPDFEWLSIQEPEEIDFSVDPARARPCYEEVRRYWPALPEGALVPGYSGVRPKIHGPGEPMPDWRIDGPETHGIPGLINLFGIESPGLTACLALGDHITGLLSS